MDERDKRKIGEQLEPGGRPKAPGHLELLQRFVNTHNHDFPARLGSARDRGEGRGLAAREGADRRGTRCRNATWLELREFREALRALIVLRLGGLSAALLVTVGEDGRTALEPARTGIEGVKARLLAIVHELKTMACAGPGAMA